MHDAVRRAARPEATAAIAELIAAMAREQRELTAAASPVHA
jgi:hypothetical protein